MTAGAAPLPLFPYPTSSLLMSLVDHYLQYFNYVTALFYAERLYHSYPSQEHLFLLSKCYYLQGKYKQVYYLLRNSSSSSSSPSISTTTTSATSSSYSNRYLFALVCYQLKKYSECEETLLPYQLFNPLNMTTDDVTQIPGGSNGLYLLGLVCRKEQRKSYAIKYFEKCLEVRVEKLSLTYSLPSWIICAGVLFMSYATWVSN